MADDSRIMTLPTVPLRGTAVYPGTMLNFDVERPASIAALNLAIGSDRMVFLVAQKDITKAWPTGEDLHTVGTVCRLGQILRVPGTNNYRAIVEGLHRARLLRITAETPCFWANVQLMADKPFVRHEQRTEALIRRCSELFSEYGNVSGNVTPEMMLKIIDKEDPGFVSDYIAQNVFLRFQDKQTLLEETDPVNRLVLLSSMLDRELNILDIEQDLSETTNERMQKQQREYWLREQMKSIRAELGEGDEENESEEYRRKIRELKLSEEIEKKLLKEVERLQKQPFGSSEGAVIRGYLDACLELPWNEKTEEVVDIVQARKTLDEDHYGLEKVKDRIIEYLAVRQLTEQVKGGVLCLVGPPGVGKTSIAMSIARATNRKLGRISLGGVHDEAEIRGHRKTYVGAMPGRIMNGITQSKSKNPVLVLDEIDKLGSDYRGDPSAALLEALDGEQNHSFRDHFLEIPFDLSEVFFITTANTTDTIPRALLDRMEVIELGSYTDEEKLHIAKEHLLPKQRLKHGLNGNSLRMTDGALRELIASYTRESGVRVLEREIASVCRKAAARIAAGEAKSLRLKEGTLEEILGPAKYKKENYLGESTVGLVHGLAWTSVGGEVLDVECTALPGSGKLELTGNLGNVMKESCQAAISYIRSRAAVLGIDPEFYRNTDIHIHFPEGAVPKDGPSAGCAITLCVVSALSGVPVRRDVCMTGEITLRGRVLPIGGLREKTMAALRADIREVIIPAGNVSDLEEIDRNVRSQLHFTSVEHLDAVLAAALDRSGLTAAESAGEAERKLAVLPETQDRKGITICQ
ncbi:MAG: endopeptidase La [Oscillospiraceae bacterium]|nr:endopeptidase La [Oscillospiraceae bacterium]